MISLHIFLGKYFLFKDFLDKFSLSLCGSVFFSDGFSAEILVEISVGIFFW